MPKKINIIKKNKFLLARRGMQLLILVAFITGPWFGIYIAQGTLSSSLWFNQLRLSDPFILLQSLLAGHPVALTGLTSALTVVVFYFLVGGRVFCGWVCPINMVTDAAQYLRQCLGWSKASRLRLDKRLRYFILVAVLLLSLMSGLLVWDLINPISLSLRALVFGLWLGGVLAVSAVFLFDFLILTNGWCGHICPVGALYGLIGKKSVLKVSATDRSACTSCGDCFKACPEPQVITPALRGTKNHGIRIDDIDCLRCGRCIDVCDEQVFSFTLK